MISLIWVHLRCSSFEQSPSHIHKPAEGYHQAKSSLTFESGDLNQWAILTYPFPYYLRKIKYPSTNEDPSEHPMTMTDSRGFHIWLHHSSKASPSSSPQPMHWITLQEGAFLLPHSYCCFPAKALYKYLQLLSPPISWLTCKAWLFCRTHQQTAQGEFLAPILTSLRTRELWLTCLLSSGAFRKSALITAIV